MRWGSRYDVRCLALSHSSTGLSYALDDQFRKFFVADVIMLLRFRNGKCVVIPLSMVFELR